MPKSVGAKRTPGSGQSKSLPVPPAKKSRKETSKIAPPDKENVSPKEALFSNKTKPIVPAVQEQEKQSVEKVISEDPVSQRLAVVEHALEDEKQAGLLELPSYVREILRIAVPTSLGHGSAADERHAFQEKMADTIGAHLQRVVFICEKNVKEQEEWLKTANMTKEQGESVLFSLEAKLKENDLLVKQKQEILDDAEKALSAAKEQVPQKERDEIEAELKKTRSQRDQYQKVLTSTFDVLKACDWSSSAHQKKGEKKLFGPLNTLVKQIGADPSLVEAASNALAKNPAQRGDFDVMVVDQLEAVLRQPLLVLDDQIRQQESSKEKKETEMHEGQTAVALAEQQLRDCENELIAYRKDQSELLAQVDECKTTSKSSAQIFEQARSTCDANLRLLEQANKSSAAFKFLYERRTALLPEIDTPVAEVTVVPTENPKVTSHGSQVTATEMATEIADAYVADEAAGLMSTEPAMPYKEAESQEGDLVTRLTREEEPLNASFMLVVEQKVTELSSTNQVGEVDKVKVDLEMPAGEQSAVDLPAADVQEKDNTVPEEEPTEVADPCWDFVQGLEPGSDPFSDKFSSSKDPSKLKQECRDLNAVAVTTTGQIKFALPPRNEWVPPRDGDDEFGTWVWTGNDEVKKS